MLDTFSNLNELKIVPEKKEISFSVYDPVEIVPTVIHELALADVKMLSVYEKKKSLETVYFDYLGRMQEND